ncbi:hypothetical protein LMG28138_06066 [Pararobbsia alpina]|uniref:Uncharacterized protein n=1 Tax=Pararobbsia alpina TaxID=621374 RepID=A0A6S7C3C1_9BURK|nr:hypothetical protein LMG28138_06066 [Pararobbsia alpina]
MRDLDEAIGLREPVHAPAPILVCHGLESGVLARKGVPRGRLIALPSIGLPDLDHDPVVAQALEDPARPTREVHIVNTARQRQRDGAQLIVEQLGGFGSRRAEDRIAGHRADERKPAKQPAQQPAPD